MSDTAEAEIPFDKVQLARIILERAALKLERQPGNRVYKSAFKTAAKIVREMKPGA